MATACKKAAALRHRYQMGAHCDLETVLEGEGLEVIRYPFRSGLVEIIYDDTIGISTHIESTAEIRQLVAHAIGHHICHAGNHLCLYTIDPVIMSQHEQQAETFAQHLLVPDRCLARYLKNGYSEWEIAEAFEVTPEWLSRRLDAFRTIRCQASRLTA